MKKFSKIFAMGVIALVTLCSLVACKNSAGGSGGNGSSVIIEFGQWPQTIKAATVNVDKNTSESKKVGMFTYYKGDDDEWYCEVRERAYSTEEQYIYSDGTKVLRSDADSYKWFKVEPIKWRVLTNNYNGKKLLFAESGLYANVAYYDVWNVNREINGNTVYPNNYEHSKIRAWLNGIVYNKSGTNSDEYNNKGFLQTAFTVEEQAKIVETVVDNSKESTNPASNETEFNNGINDYVCSDTTDKIFLLSMKEITTSGYGFAKYTRSDNTRKRKPTDFALANTAFKDAAYGGLFFVRSPYDNESGSARKVYYGNLYNFEHVSNQNVVVVPALCVD